MQKITATIEIIGINPYIRLPEEILEQIFTLAGKRKSPIQIKGTINDKPYRQTLVKFCGQWRLYINTVMLKNSPRRIGEVIELTVTFDPEKKIPPPQPQFTKALHANKEAKIIFDNLRPSLQREIFKYISSLKTGESVNRNVAKAINFLLGKDKFAGRDKP